LAFYVGAASLGFGLRTRIRIISTTLEFVRHSLNRNFTDFAQPLS